MGLARRDGVPVDDRTEAIVEGDAEPTLRDLQVAQREWALDKFGAERKASELPGLRPLLSAASWVGQVAHSHLKQHQGIRLDEDHARHAQLACLEAIGDIRAYMRARGWRPGPPVEDDRSWQASGSMVLLGVMEEVGELCEAQLRREDVWPEGAGYDAEAKDAVADVQVYLMDFCNRNGWDMLSLLISTCEQVFKRDWKRFPADGKTH
jgi:NTP pyrophosphatase (non-canonical NTP hydrolase)